MSTTTDDTDTRVTNHRQATRADALPARPVAVGRFESFGAYAQAARAGQVDDAYRAMVLGALSRPRGMFRAALADAVIADMPGLVPEAWISEVIDVMGSASATVQAFRQIPLPDTGMTVNMPVVLQHPDVGKQATEKTDVATRKMIINPAAFTVHTYAGGQDISIQALMRSTPAYLDVLMRAFAIEMATNLDKDVAAALVAAAVPALPLSAADLNGSMVDATVALLNKSLRFPEVMVLGTNVWAAMGKAVDTAGRPLFPGLSPWNPVGDFSLVDATGNVRGLGYYVDPMLPAGDAVIGVREAFTTLLGSVGTLTADVPEVLGRDVAVFRFAAYGATDPRGLVGLTLGALAADAAASSSSSASKKA